MSPIVTTNSSPAGRIRRVRGAVGLGYSIAVVETGTGTPVADAKFQFAGGTHGDLSAHSIFVQFPKALTNGASNAVEYTVTVTGRNGSDTLSFDAWRFDGNSGTVMVVGAIPLKPGRLLYGDISETGWEEPRYDSAHAAFGYATPALHAGTQNKAVFACMDTSYLLQTNVAMVPLQDEDADATVDAAVAQLYQTAAGTPRTLGGAWDIMDASYHGAATGGTTYEHTHGAWCGYIRANTRAKKRLYFQRAYECYRNQACGKAGYDAQLGIGSATEAYATWIAFDPSIPVPSSPTDYGLPGEANTGMHMGLVTGYLLTGISHGRMRLSHWLSGEGIRGTIISNTVRFNMSRVLMPLLCAYKIHATLQVPGGYGAGWNNDTGSLKTKIEAALNNVFANMYTTANYGAWIDGVVGQSPTYVDGPPVGLPGEFPSFQEAIVSKVLMFCYRNVIPDSRIPAAIIAAANFLLALTRTKNNDIPASVDGIVYGNKPTWAENDGEDFYYPPVVVAVYANAYAFTGSSTYRTATLRAARKVQLDDAPGGGGPQAIAVKQVGEYWSGDQLSVPALLNDVGVLPYGAAHPTVLVDPPTWVP